MGITMWHLPRVNDSSKGAMVIIESGTKLNSKLCHKHSKTNLSRASYVRQNKTSTYALQSEKVEPLTGVLVLDKNEAWPVRAEKMRIGLTGFPRPCGAVG